MVRSHTSYEKYGNGSVRHDVKKWHIRVDDFQKLEASYVEAKTEA